MKTYVKYPPRKLQSEGYTGPITLSDYERFQWVRELAREGGRQHSDADRQLIDLASDARHCRAVRLLSPTLIAGGGTPCCDAT